MEKEVRRAFEKIYRKEPTQLLVKVTNKTIYRGGVADCTAGEVYAGCSTVDIGRAQRLED